MASFGPGRWNKSFRVAATVSAYRVVALDTSTSSGPRIIQIPTETSYILGISQDYADTTSAQFAACPVSFFGDCKAAAGASVSAGALLTFVTATAYVIEVGNANFDTGATSFATSGSKMPKLLGVALSVGTATDAVIEVALNISNFRIRVT